MKRRDFLRGTAALAPAILGAEDKAGSKLPVLGSGEHIYEAQHDWGELPAQIKLRQHARRGRGFPGPHLRAPHRQRRERKLRLHGGLRRTKGKFVKSWGKEFKGGAHGLHIRKEGSTEFLYLCDTKRGVVVKATLDGEEVYTLGYPDQSDAYKPGAGRQAAEVQPHQPRDRAQRRPLRGRRLRLELHQPVQQQGRVSPHLRRQRQGAGQSWIARTASPWTCAGETPILTVADRANNRIQRFTLDGQHLDFVARHQPALPLRLLPERRRGGARPGRAGDADGPQQPGDRAPGRRFGQQVAATRASCRATISRPASSSARTAPASTTTATSSWWSGWKWAASPSCARSERAYFG